ncbi:MAG: hypothetical protein EXR12_08940 [Rhodospirillaceae bacterium]|nr:hypothetical protein [Rhodospirillaceae bacterium]
MTKGKFDRLLSAAVLLVGISGGVLPASAQNAPIEFRVVAAKGNPSGCMSLDGSLSRVHTITLVGDKAMLKSAGGINDTLKQTAAGVYKTRLGMGGVNLDVVADVSKSPRNLEVTEASRGCHWNAVAP